MERIELSPAHIAWTQLKEMRDHNRKLADSSDMLMQAIETAPELDEALCVSMGIKPRNPLGNPPPKQ